jgi:hypothetical protein
MFFLVMGTVENLQIIIRKLLYFVADRYFISEIIPAQPSGLAI